MTTMKSSKSCSNEADGGAGSTHERAINAALRCQWTAHLRAGSGRISGNFPRK